MAFKVGFNLRKPEWTDYGDSARYEVLDSGVLVITEDDGVRTHYSPHVWLSVEDTAP